MCGVAGAALAAPRGPDPRDAKLQMMEQQLQQMNAELTQLRASGGSSDEKLSAIQAQMDAFAKDMAELKGASEVATADILTLKAPPAGNAVTATLGNGKPTFATADGRFTANIKSVMQFDAAYYNQAAVGPVNTDFRRSGSGAGAIQLSQDFPRSRVYRCNTGQRKFSLRRHLRRSVRGEKWSRQRSKLLTFNTPHSPGIARWRER